MPLYKGPSDKAGAGAKRSLAVGEDDNENDPKKRMLYDVKDESSDRSIAPNLYNSNGKASTITSYSIGISTACRGGLPNFHPLWKSIPCTCSDFFHHCELFLNSSTSLIT